ncbi:rho-related GTP-binding protein RhoF-like [Salvelinus fontinalis]|uniref:rho-related GTP-binding protein RhoF-like n=1 Tax=Salvelinus fontinalis TaxID=8038 RepID=UPI002485E8C1|nr:rho-related GTP-binding protein RhoF-like [Salvelinus fontinalis]
MPQNVSGMSSGHTRRREELKVVILGDGGCGKTSLLMVYTKKYFPEWYPEVHHFCHGVPIILVGCKTDLQKDKVLARKLWSSGQNPITYIQGEETKRKIKAELYLECSAKYKENVEDIFRGYQTSPCSNKEIQKGKEERILCPSVTQEIMLSTTVSS